LLPPGAALLTQAYVFFRRDFPDITGHAAIHAPIAATAVSIGDERVELLQNEQVK